MIRVEHLYKAYNKDEFVLEDINCVISKGDVVAIIGPSGNGKTTLLNCLNLLERPTQGRIYLDGEDILDPKCDLSRVRQKVGMVFQDFRLFENLNVIDNITLAPMKVLGLTRDEAEDQARKLLKTVGLAKKASAMPQELSGGQKQRLAIARTLAMNPEVILFDEPTSALDPTMVSEVYSVISSLAKKGLTIVIVTHRLSFAEQIATRVFFMHKGRIWEEGGAREIFENPLKEETRLYIKRIRGLHFEIEDADYDLYQLNSTIQSFAMRYFFSKERLLSLYHIVEEILAVLDKDSGITIDMEYSEKDRSVRMKVLYKGQKNVLLDDPDIDPISMAIIQGYCQDIEQKRTTEGTEISINIAE